MITQNEVEEIIKLIKDGFDLEIISFEFDIPMENLLTYKKQLESIKQAKESVDQMEVQVPRKKSSNIRKKEKQLQNDREKDQKINLKENTQSLEKAINPNYEEVITRYKEEIVKNPKDVLNKRNILAFAYLKAGKIDEAREELEALIEQYSNYTAYRQIIHLEKSEGQLDDAKLWAYDCLDKFPNDEKIKKMLNLIEYEEER